MLLFYEYLPHCLNYKTSVILKCLRRDWTDEGKRSRSKPVRFRINHPPGIWHSCENYFLCQALYPWKKYLTSSSLAHCWDFWIFSVQGVEQNWILNGKLISTQVLISPVRTGPKLLLLNVCHIKPALNQGKYCLVTHSTENRYLLGQICLLWWLWRCEDLHHVTVSPFCLLLHLRLSLAMGLSSTWIMSPGFCALCCCWFGWIWDYWAVTGLNWNDFIYS